MKLTYVHIDPNEFKKKIPDFQIDHIEVAKQMRINADILMKEITDHVNKEIARFKEQINEKTT